MNLATTLWLSAGVAVASPLAPTRAGYPSKPITLVAPANPGGGWDQSARVIQQVLRTEGIVGVPVEVVNRGGAGGTIGLAELVTRHRRDPHTLLVGGGVMLGATQTHASPFGLNDTVPLARLVSEHEVVAVAAGFTLPNPIPAHVSWCSFHWGSPASASERGDSLWRRSSSAWSWVLFSSRSYGARSPSRRETRVCFSPVLCPCSLFASRFSPWLDRSWPDAGALSLRRKAEVV